MSSAALSDWCHLSPVVIRNLCALRGHFCVIHLFFISVIIITYGNTWKHAWWWLAIKWDASSHGTLKPHGDHYLTCEKISNSSFRALKMTLKWKGVKVRRKGWQGSSDVTGAGLVVETTTYRAEVTAQEILEWPVLDKPSFCLCPLL